MTTITKTSIKNVFSIHWNPNKDLAVVGVSWLLVVASLYTATVIVGPQAWGGMAYFILYALVCATLFGVGIPLYWMAVVRRRPLADLGIMSHKLGLSLILQLIFTVVLYAGVLAKTHLPPMEELVPLITLALAIGFFEVIFWRRSRLRTGRSIKDYAGLIRLISS